MPTWIMSGMSPKDIKILLRVDRQQALYRFLRDFFIPMLGDRNYSFGDLAQAAASWAFDKGEKAAAHYLWDAANEFYIQQQNL
ncbi:hypothetical protein [Nostoc sp.]|uniref:hypothetical protein n=1 Tax=Nostoc sp. TaxID=1180 RepID=UPI002FFC6F45